MSLTNRATMALPSFFFMTVLLAQTTPSIPSTATAVPRLVRVNGLFHPANGSAVSAVESAVISVYATETGGTPLWQETQNIPVDADGHYSLLLGATRNEGLPVELFPSREPRWLGVQFQRAGEVEQPRTLLASVPYALKAADSETLAGRPASDYVLAPTASQGPDAAAGAVANPAPSHAANVTKSQPRVDSGTTNCVAKFLNGTDVGCSTMTDNGLVGVGTTTPLDVMHVRFTNTNGGLTGYAVQNMGNTNTSFSGMLFYDQNGALGQFQGFNNVSHEYRINNIATGGSINFMLGSNSKFQVRSDGDVDVPGSIRKNGTLFLHNLGTNSVAVGLGALVVNGGSDNTATGSQALFSNSSGNFNTADGFQSLYSNTTGVSNTGYGSVTLYNSTTGCCNTAIGDAALYSNTIGYNNTASGDRALFNNTVGFQNTATGVQALFGNTDGANNTANGWQALYNNTTGLNNTATGIWALHSNAVGNNNTASGDSALFSNTIGYDNTASGDRALYSNTLGCCNTATGDQALYNNTTGNDNVAMGSGALYYNTTGDVNIALGHLAGFNITSGGNNIALGTSAGLNITSGSNNIDIGNQGNSTDSGVIRIGTAGTQTSFFAAGISNSTVTGAIVLVDTTTGQLGIASSSRRYKEDIQDISDASSGLLRLRPVTFRYQKPFPDGSKPLDYGLIAEEVAEIYPDLVVRNKDGQIETVQYQKLTPMLLNELQKQHATIERQNREIEELKAKVAAVSTLESRLAALEVVRSGKDVIP